MRISTKRLIKDLPKLTREALAPLKLNEDLNINDALNDIEYTDLTVTNEHGYTTLRQLVVFEIEEFWKDSHNEVTLRDLLTNEIATQTLQIVFPDKDKKDLTEAIMCLHFFVLETIGKLPEKNDKDNPGYIYTALILHETVITPIVNILKSIQTSKKLKDIPYVRIQESLKEAGFNLSQKFNQTQSIHIHGNIKELTPLAFASYSGNRLLTQTLLMYPGVVDLEQKQQIAIKEAILSSNLHIVKLLIMQIDYDLKQIIQFTTSTEVAKLSRQSDILKLLKEEDLAIEKKLEISRNEKSQELKSLAVINEELSSEKNKSLSGEALMDAVTSLFKLASDVPIVSDQDINSFTHAQLDAAYLFLEDLQSLKKAVECYLKVGRENLTKYFISKGDAEIENKGTKNLKKALNYYLYAKAFLETAPTSKKTDRSYSRIITLSMANHKISKVLLMQNPPNVDLAISYAESSVEILNQLVDAPDTANLLIATRKWYLAECMKKKLEPDWKKISKNLLSASHHFKQLKLKTKEEKIRNAECLHETGKALENLEPPPWEIALIYYKEAKNALVLSQFGDKEFVDDSKKLKLSGKAKFAKLAVDDEFYRKLADYTLACAKALDKKSPPEPLQVLTLFDEVLSYLDKITNKSPNDHVKIQYVTAQKSIITKSYKAILNKAPELKQESDTQKPKQKPKPTMPKTDTAEDVNIQLNNTFDIFFNSDYPEKIDSELDEKYIPLSENTPNIIKNYLKLRFNENGISCSRTSLNSFIKLLKNKTTKGSVKSRKIADYIIKARKQKKAEAELAAAQRKETFKEKDEKVDVTEIKYAELKKSITSLWLEADYSITVFTQNLPAIRKILNSKYANALLKAHITEESLTTETTELTKLKAKLNEIENNKSKGSQTTLKLLDSLKELQHQSTLLKTRLENNLEIFNKLNNIVNSKTDEHPDTSKKKLPSKSTVQETLDRNRQEREEKKRKDAEEADKYAREQADRKSKWQKEQEQKKAAQKKAQQPSSEAAFTKEINTDAQKKNVTSSKSKATAVPHRPSVSHQQQTFLHYSLKNLLCIGFHYAGHVIRTHEKESNPSFNVIDEALFENITHYSLLYTMSRCFHALKRYKDFGGQTSAALPKEDVEDFRNMIIHHGAIEADKSSVINTAEQLYRDLPKDLIDRKNAHQLLELKLEQDQILKLIRSYKLTTDLDRFSVDCSYPLVVDDMPLYQQLFKYHDAKTEANTSNEKMMEVVWTKVVPIIKNIMTALLKAHPSEPLSQKDQEKFYECYLPHLQALKMLLTICGEFRTEDHCDNIVKQMQHLEVKDDVADDSSQTATKESIGDSILFYKFLGQCRSIRNKVAHDFPEDCRINDVYHCWRLIKSVKKPPQLEVSKLKALSIPSAIDQDEKYTLMSLDEGSDETRDKEARRVNEPKSNSYALFKRAIQKKNFEFVPTKTTVGSDTPTA